MVEIIKKKFDQDLFLNLWCNPLGYFAKMNSTLGSVVPLAMFYFLASWPSLSHDHWCLSRASQRWTFYGFSNESHHSDEPGHEGLALQQMKQSQGLGTHFGSSRIRDVANL